MHKPTVSKVIPLWVIMHGLTHRSLALTHSAYKVGNLDLSVSPLRAVVIFNCSFGVKNNIFYGVNNTIYNISIL